MLTYTILRKQQTNKAKINLEPKATLLQLHVRMFTITLE